MGKHLPDESGKRRQLVSSTSGTVLVPDRAFDVWHDRAVFHFLITDEQRNAYVKVVEEVVKPGAHAIVSTFGPEGPTRCSGLPAVRYDAEQLRREFGTHFRLIEGFTESHHTPSGTVQQFPGRGGAAPAGGAPGGGGGGGGRGGGGRGGGGVPGPVTLHRAK